MVRFHGGFHFLATGSVIECAGNAKLPEVPMSLTHTRGDDRHPARPGTIALARPRPAHKLPAHAVWNERVGLHVTGVMSETRSAQSPIVLGLGLPQV